MEVPENVQNLIDNYRDFAATLLLVLMGEELSERTLDALEEQHAEDIDRMLGEIWPYDKRVLEANAPEEVLAGMDARVQGNLAQYESAVEGLTEVLAKAQKKRAKLIKSVAKKMHEVGEESEESEETDEEEQGSEMEREDEEIEEADKEDEEDEKDEEDDDDDEEDKEDKDDEGEEIDEKSKKKNGSASRPTMFRLPFGKPVAQLRKRK